MLVVVVVLVTASSLTEQPNCDLSFSRRSSSRISSSRISSSSSSTCFFTYLLAIRLFVFFSVIVVVFCLALAWGYLSMWWRRCADDSHLWLCRWLVVWSQKHTLSCSCRYDSMGRLLLRRRWHASECGSLQMRTCLGVPSHGPVCCSVAYYSWLNFFAAQLWPDFLFDAPDLIHVSVFV